MDKFLGVVLAIAVAFGMILLLFPAVGIIFGLLAEFVKSIKI